MSLPHLLLVDDSEAILACEKAALSAHYMLSTASNGREALEKLPQLLPAALLLDLSMPEMDGEEVFARMQELEALREIPVIVISSEERRAQQCLRLGAAAFLPKPIRADALLALVGEVLDEARRKKRRGSLACLPVSVGGREFAVPLDALRQVLQQPATRPLPTGPDYLSEVFELYGEPVFVLDTARRLGLEHVQPLLERKLVVVAHEGLSLALCVDEVRDPEEIPAADVLPRDRLGGAEHGDLRDTLVAVVRTPRGLVPVIAAQALLAPELLARLSALIQAGLPQEPDGLELHP